MMAMYMVGPGETGGPMVSDGFQGLVHLEPRKENDRRGQKQASFMATVIMNMKKGIIASIRSSPPHRRSRPHWTTSDTKFWWVSMAFADPCGPRCAAEGRFLRIHLDGAGDPCRFPGPPREA
jgi:hypothetical protein